MPLAYEVRDATDISQRAQSSIGWRCQDL